VYVEQPVLLVKVTFSLDVTSWTDFESKKDTFIEALQHSIGCDSSTCRVLLFDPLTGQEVQRRRLSVDVEAQILFLNETDTSSQLVVSSVQALRNTTQINSNLASADLTVLSSDVANPTAIPSYSLEVAPPPPLAPPAVPPSTGSSDSGVVIGLSLGLSFLFSLLVVLLWKKSSAAGTVDNGSRPERGLLEAANAYPLVTANAEIAQIAQKKGVASRLAAVSGRFSANFGSKQRVTTQVKGEGAPLQKNEVTMATHI